MIDKKIKSDTFINITSFGIVGVSALILNFIIAYFYDSYVLGLFNLFYALFIFFSQLVGAGIHFSVLKNIAQYESNSKAKAEILINGLVSTLINAALWLMLIYSTKPVFTSFFTDEKSVSLIDFLIPALLFFVVNKVLLAYQNAIKNMRYYAFVNALRPTIMVVFVLVIVALKLDYKYIILTFLVSASFAFIVLIISTLSILSKGRLSLLWMKEHFKHGYKSAVGSVLIDVNTRVDVLMLGYFANEKMVGVYSLASMIVDGFSQLPIVFRTIINPYITNLYYQKRTHQLQEKLTYGRNLTYKYLVPLGIVVIIGYVLILNRLGFKDEYSESVVPMGILMTGLLSSIGYAPFLMIFNQIGMPGTQSWLYFYIFITNVLFNLILIPYFGIIGAAVATSISYVSLVFYLKLIAKKKSIRI